MCRTFPIIADAAEANTTVVPSQPSPTGAMPPRSQGQPSKLEKERMKLTKTVHQIVKIEEQKARGDRVDKLQLQKLARRTEVEEQLAAVMRAIAEEEEHRPPSEREAEEEELEQVPEEEVAATSPQAVRFHTPAWLPAGQTPVGFVPPMQPAVEAATGMPFMVFFVPAAPQAAPLNGPLQGAVASVAPAPQRQPVEDAAACPLRGRVLSKSFDAAGCREVQAALPVLDQRTTAELVSELHGHTWSLLKSPYGNYVIQKVIEVVPPAQASFIVDELRGGAAAAAKHKFGCRILCRLLEHFTGHAGLNGLLEELLLQAEELACHPYAHHVMEALLEHGVPEHRRWLVQALCWDLTRCASDRHGCYVIEVACLHCDPDEQEMLVQALLPAGPSRLLDLAQSRSGSLSVRALLKCQGATSPLIASILQSQAPLLSKTKFGRRLLQDLSPERHAPPRAYQAAAKAA